MQSSMLKSWTGFRANCAAPRPAQRRAAVQQRGQLSVRAAVVAAPAELEVKSLEGEDKGTATLSLKVRRGPGGQGNEEALMCLHQGSACSLSAATRTHSECFGGDCKSASWPGCAAHVAGGIVWHRSATAPRPAARAAQVAEESAKGLVHRYLVYAQQNARRVSGTQLKEYTWSSCTAACNEALAAALQLAHRAFLSFFACFCILRLLSSRLSMLRLRAHPSAGHRQHTDALGGAGRRAQALQAEGQRQRAARLPPLAAHARRRHLLWPQAP